MSIKIWGHNLIGSTINVAVDVENVEEFKELIQRGANLWPDASAEIKRFADLVTNGKEMQSYVDDKKQIAPVEADCACKFRKYLRHDMNTDSKIYVCKNCGKEISVYWPLPT